MAKRTLQISKIRLDGNTQPRVELDEWLIAEYKEAYQAGVTMPPLEVMFDGASYWLWDGFHRRWGAERAGLDKLPCNVTNGTREDAQWASYGTNVTHGLRRTNADKAKAVQSALKHPIGSTKSDNQIAEHCGVSNRMVAKYREELASAMKLSQVTTRTGKDGKAYDTANIGKPRKSAEPVDDEPDDVEEPDDEGTEDFDDKPMEVTPGKPWRETFTVPNVQPTDEQKAAFVSRLEDWLSEQASDLDVKLYVVIEWTKEYLP